MRTIATVVLAAVTIAGCSGGASAGGPLGFTEPPASLDPASPQLVAKDIAFSTQALDVKAGTSFILVFDNQDTVSHNVSIVGPDGATTKVFDGVVFAGPGKRWYPVPALAAGTYVFQCDLHPNMRGTLRAT